jgi:hypothetical protein
MEKAIKKEILSKIFLIAFFEEIYYLSPERAIIYQHRV